VHDVAVAAVRLPPSAHFLDAFDERAGTVAVAAQRVVVAVAVATVTRGDRITNPGANSLSTRSMSWRSIAVRTGYGTTPT